MFKLIPLLKLQWFQGELRDKWKILYLCLLSCPDINLPDYGNR